MANEKYAIELIQKCCKEYRAGVLVRDLCAKYNVPRSTIYSWIERHRNDRTQDIQYKKRLAHLRAQHEKTKQINRVLKKVKCTVSSPLREKLYELEKLHGQFSVRVLCEALEVDRGTFYNHLYRNKKQNTEFAEKKAILTEMVKEIYHNSREIYGSDKILAVIRERGICTCVQTIRKIMTELGLRSLRHSAKKDRKKWEKLYETKNVLRRQFNFDEPNMAWVSDCTEFRLFNKKFHICAVMDLFSRKIIAYKVSERASTRLITQTFKEAYESRKPDERLIFHSDQGCQYTSRTFRTLLRKMHVTQSFSKKATPYDNSVIESFFSTLKLEELYRSRYVSEASFRRYLAAYIDFYNNERPHKANKDKAPTKKEELYYQKMCA